MGELCDPFKGKSGEPWNALNGRKSDKRTHNMQRENTKR